MSQDLLDRRRDFGPCPFCRESTSMCYFQYVRVPVKFSVTCLKCDSYGPSAETEEQAIRLWNQSAEYERKLSLIQKYQKESDMPEPYRTAICNILANGRVKP